MSDNTQITAVHDRRPLPEGTVTFVFTDIEGSTTLLRRLRGRYGEMIGAHGRLIRHALHQHGGWEIDTQGDAFFCVFGRAGSAVAFAAAVQSAIAEHDWPDGVRVRLRIAIHTGEPELADRRYYGLDVHRTARLCATARGGEVVLSELAASLVQEQLPREASLVEKGDVELKDFPGTTRVFRLALPGAEAVPAAPYVVSAEPFRGAHETLGQRVAEAQRPPPPPQHEAGGREILLVAESPEGVEELLAFARSAACRDHARGMILTSVVDDQEDVLPATRMLAGFREHLAGTGVKSRVAAFRAADAAAAVEKLALRQEVGLVVAGAARLVDGDGDGLATGILRSAPCDVALHLARPGASPQGPVMVPFAGTEHDWAALELATTIAASTGASLVLTGSNAASDGDEGDASRLLAAASLIVQQIGGLIAEPLLIPRGADAVVTAAAQASHVLTGVPADYDVRGIGSTRREVARRVGTTVTLVRRGVRSGVISADRDVTRFSWTGTSSGS
jgi:class 3 adenylate cyclase